MFIDAVLHHDTGTIDAGFRDRVRLYGVVGAISDLPYGVKSNREVSRAVGQRALERLSFLPRRPTLTFPIVGAGLTDAAFCRRG